MKTPLFLAALALALVAQDAAAQTLAGTMAAGAIGSSLQGIGGMNYGAIKSQARGVSNANNNYQSTLNGLMTDPNNTTTAQQPPPPPPQPTGVQAGTQTGGALGGANTNLTRTSTRPISTWGATGLASLSANPRNIMSTIGNNSAGTNQLSSRPRISLRVQTMRISNPRTSGISTRGGATGGTNQLGGAGGGQQQQGGAGGGVSGGGGPPPIDPNAIAN